MPKHQKKPPTPSESSEEEVPSELESVSDDQNELGAKNFESDYGEEGEDGEDDMDDDLVGDDDEEGEDAEESEDESDEDEIEASEK